MESQFKMVDVGSKTATRRRAQAQGEILLSQAAMDALRNQNNPKGNALGLAEVAGIMAAKKASDFIPLCHPLPLDQVRLQFEFNVSRLAIKVLCEVSAFAKTGVEMEALAGVHGALLSLYDFSKAVDPVLTLSDIRLNWKEGGKHGKWFHPQFRPTEAEGLPLASVKAGVLTVSDRVSAGKAQDSSGPALVEFLESCGSEVCLKAVVSDDSEKIQIAIQKGISENAVRLVLVTGGTGLGPRDITPEAIEGICDRMIPGFGELLRSSGAQSTQMAWLSRSVAGLIGETLVIALPGSEKAVREGVGALRDLLPHALDIAQGGAHK